MSDKNATKSAFTINKIFSPEKMSRKSNKWQVDGASLGEKKFELSSFHF